MTTSEAERAAMRRALELAVTPGVPLGPNPRVGCVLLAADGTVDGIFTPCVEVTEQVIGARRLEMLRRLGATRAEARDKAYAAVDAIEAPSLFCRRDIGWRELARLKG